MQVSYIPWQGRSPNGRQVLAFQMHRAESETEPPADFVRRSGEELQSPTSRDFGTLATLYVVGREVNLGRSCLDANI